jgi:excisionase family DNA binding protein
VFIVFKSHNEVMRSDFIDQLTNSENDDLLTTGEAAKLLGTSRQHVVDLANQGDLPVVMVGSHRRIRRSDLAKQTVRARPRTRDQTRSLWLGYAVAGQLVESPDLLIESARHQLVRASTKRRNKWNDEWSDLLDGPIERVLEALTSNTVRSRELRQNSPFAGALSEERRSNVLEQFRRAHPGGGE